MTEAAPLVRLTERSWRTRQSPHSGETRSWFRSRAERGRGSSISARMSAPASPRPPHLIALLDVPDGTKGNSPLLVPGPQDQRVVINADDHAFEGRDGNVAPGNAERDMLASELR